VAAGEPALDPGWELRFTHRALDDLEASGELPGIIEDIRRATPHHTIIDAFTSKRTEDPAAGSPIGNLGRPDVMSLHGPAGERAATWYDADHRVCWFLAYTPTHDYAHFEQRAANDELLPDDGDYAQLLAERDLTWRVHQAGRELNGLIRTALERPNKGVEGSLGSSLPCQVFAEVLVIDDESAVDVWISFRTYPAPAEAWLPSYYEAELVALIEGGTELIDAGRVTWYCTEFPVAGDVEVTYRPIDVGKETIIRLAF
jgi:hypothetical protein